ncbi:adenosylcobinamide-phosphate synthase CbiB [Calothrix sp. CCY 0018]|uniref:adenosylcobinamide-phosphate synthase CbiB n=1 Tax=Calothrix sp. CCY 0018 TaxID=3103864 RepID=UPI0039C5EC19
MTFSSAILILAASLDYSIGDPSNWVHPVQVMGWFISRLSKLALKYCHNSLTQRLAGIAIAAILVIGSGVIGWLIVQCAMRVNPIVGILVESVLLASCFAFKSLRIAAETVISRLKVGNIAEARSLLRNFVGRDTQNLTSEEIFRAVLETVTENATDGVMAPLFYAVVGAFLPIIGPSTFALAYKASSTLDSMIGYREVPYIYLGWFSARLEDCLTWFPCRLTVITLALLSRKPLHVIKICQRDAPKDSSPNSGWSECAYAAILGVQMGGTNWYRGVAKVKPLLGDAIHPITSNSIKTALQLTRYSFLLWLGGSASLLLLTTIR